MGQYYKLSDICARLGIDCPAGQSDLVIEGVATLLQAGKHQVAFLANPVYRKQLETTRAAVVILSAADRENCPEHVLPLVVNHPYVAFAKVAALFVPESSQKPGIHPTAVVGEGCDIAADASIGALCVIGDGVKIGAKSIVSPHCVIGDDVILGQQCHLWPRVTLYANVHCQDRVVMHSGVVIGADGFGFALAGQCWIKVPQLGGVRIGSDVDIGANTTIDCGALEHTIIEDDVKIDNQVQIAHNVKIGAHTVIAGCVGIAGSTTIGTYCAIGGATAIGGHLTLADQVQLTGMSMVTRSILQSGVYSSGTGIDRNANWRKNAARFRRLDELARKVQQLTPEKSE